jgi:flagellar protein FliT
MTSNAEYFARYEAIAAISARMLIAARRALWNDLVPLQEEYRHLVDALKDAETGVIRELASPRMANLSALFAGRPARVLKELYGAR